MALGDWLLCGVVERPGDMGAEKGGVLRWWGVGYGAAPVNVDEANFNRVRPIVWIDGKGKSMYIQHQLCPLTQLTSFSQHDFPFCLH